MRKINKTGIHGSQLFCLIFLYALFFSISNVVAERVRINIPWNNNDPIETGVYPLFNGTDSLFCDGKQLVRHSDYNIDARNGRISPVNLILPCDSVTVILYRIPDWLARPAGNDLPPTGEIRSINIGREFDSGPALSGGGKINLSGNKSFSFNVGRSGEGSFSQGLNIDFDAEPAPGLKVRGAISDRIDNRYVTSGIGSTTTLSELDKYFFEIEGSRVLARGGDITTVSRTTLPEKRIKGVRAAYNDATVGIEADLGRPAGRFRTQQIFGSDGRQGPYQLLDDEGRPTPVVAGSEVIYLDGNKLEGGGGHDYEIDYLTGRIVFSPGVLITSRTRIEVDFETAGSKYEQVIYDGTGRINLVGDLLSLDCAYRRESDERERLRFGALSESEIDILKLAGDDPLAARKTGVTPEAGGSYTQQTDSLGNLYYLYVGPGSGDFNVAFSRVESGSGDYRYLGDGIYEYAGKSRGDYDAVIYLPLPQSNDFFQTALKSHPIDAVNLGVNYQLNSRDKNLYSVKNEDDNSRSQVTGYLNIQQKVWKTDLSLRYREAGFDPTARLYSPDFQRTWGLTGSSPAGDELFFSGQSQFDNKEQWVDLSGGWVDYKGGIKAYNIGIDSRWFQSFIIKPGLMYRRGKSENESQFGENGLYEKFLPSLEVSPYGTLTVSFAYDFENSENHYGAVPDDEKYKATKTSLRWRNSDLTVARRTEYRTSATEITGPRQDRVDFHIDESIRRWQITLVGTWLDQKRLDSERRDLNERLLTGRVAYRPGSGWLSLVAEYRQNREEVNPTGYRYFKVSAGTGDYRYEDGQYLPDPSGDYIRIREETGTAQPVSVGEKSHLVSLYPGRMGWPDALKKVFTQIAFRMQTNVTEDMIDSRRRTASWLLPWTSTSGRDYLRRKKREEYLVYLIPRPNFYMLEVDVNLQLDDEADLSSLFRSDKSYRVEHKYQVLKDLRSRLAYTRRRWVQRGDGFSTLNLTGNEIIGGLIYTEGNLQMEPSLTYSNFEDQYSGGKGSGFWFELLGIYRAAHKGEVRFDMVLRSLKEVEPFSQPEYLITEGRRFGTSALLNLTTTYELGRSLRLHFNLTDRIFEKRPSEFVGRGELVATF